MKNFVKEVIKQTDIGVNSTLVGIIRFSQVATLETYLGELDNKVSLLSACNYTAMALPRKTTSVITLLTRHTDPASGQGRKHSPR